MREGPALTLEELDARLIAAEHRARNSELLLVAIVAALRPDLGPRGVAALRFAGEGSDSDTRARNE